MTCFGLSTYPMAALNIAADGGVWNKEYQYQSVPAKVHWITTTSKTTYPAVQNRVHNFVNHR